MTHEDIEKYTKRGNDILDMIGDHEDVAGSTNTLSHLPVATVMALAAWALSSLRKLETEKEWSAESVDRIAFDAIEMGLADTDSDDGMFVVTI